MPKIYTSYFANYRKFPVDAFKISIARYPIKTNMQLYTAEIFTPYPELIEMYKNNKITADRYKEIYLSQLQAISEQDIKYWISTFRNSPRSMLLLCYEKPSDFCHRHILREWLNDNYNLEIEEL